MRNLKDSGRQNFMASTGSHNSGYIEVPLKTIIPLWHFEMDIESFSLDKNIHFRAINSRDLDILEKGLGIYGSIHQGFVLELLWTQYRPKRPSRTTKESIETYLQRFDIDEGFKKAGRVITCLRLFKHGDVGTKFFINLGTEDSELEETGYDSSFEAYGIDPYHLGKDEISQLQDFWKCFQKWNVEKFSRHLWRFNRAYRENDLLERVVDFVTVLEGLILPDTTIELRQQFSIRIARILEKNLKNRKKTYELAKKIYDLRSSVVHGSVSHRDLKVSDANLAVSAENFTRRCLKICLEDPDICTKDRLIMMCLE